MYRLGRIFLYNQGRFICENDEDDSTEIRITKPFRIIRIREGLAAKQENL